MAISGLIAAALTFAFSSHYVAPVLAFLAVDKWQRPCSAPTFLTGLWPGWEGRQSWALNTCHKPLAQTSLA